MNGQTFRDLLAARRFLCEQLSERVQLEDKEEIVALLARVNNLLRRGTLQLVEAAE